MPIPLVLEVVQSVVTAYFLKILGARFVGRVGEVMNPLVDECGDGEE